MKRIIASILIFLFVLTGSLSAKGKKYRFNNVRIENEAIAFDLQIINFIDQDVLKGLRKGMTAGIEFNVQLWKIRPRWADHLVAEQIVRMKLNFDTWERRYVLVTRDQPPQLLNEEEIRTRCSRLVNFSLADAGELERNSRYFIAVKAVLTPMSMENYQEIKGWLAGEVRQIDPKAIGTAKEPGKKAGNWLLGLVLNLTGFGDRIVSAKSPVFGLREGALVYEKER